MTHPRLPEFRWCRGRVLLSGLGYGADSYWETGPVVQGAGITERPWIRLTPTEKQVRWCRGRVLLSGLGYG